jgi:hypothetical protein
MTSKAIETGSQRYVAARIAAAPWPA